MSFHIAGDLDKNKDSVGLSRAWSLHFSKIPGDGDSAGLQECTLSSWAAEHIKKPFNDYSPLCHLIDQAA